MDLKQAIQKLKTEGFARVDVREDPPKKFYGEHTHDSKAAYVVLEGELAFTMEGKTYTLKEDHRIDVKPNTIHFLKTGSKGCWYLVCQVAPAAEDPA